MTSVFDIPLVDVVEVKPLEDYRLLVVFEDGKRGIFDSSPYLDGEVFKPLRDRSLFRAATISYGTVVWPGEIDIAPERLYTDMVPLEEPRS